MKTYVNKLVLNQKCRYMGNECVVIGKLTYVDRCGTWFIRRVSDGVELALGPEVPVEVEDGDAEAFVREWYADTFIGEVPSAYECLVQLKDHFDGA
jgi:hypothetical protein